MSLILVGTFATPARATFDGGTCAPIDSTCDGIDDDCDGVIDDDFVSAIGSSRQTICSGGIIIETCTPYSSVDDSCNAIDDDCDGQIDEDAGYTMTTCGLGSCTSWGYVACVNGTTFDTCTPGTPPASTDDMCNGADDDCDGMIDEDYLSQPSTCGTGVCANTGGTVCSNGFVYESCMPAMPLAWVDSTCDDVDDDCDGMRDEDYFSSMTSCGQGVCAAMGSISCTAGQVVDSCTPGTPPASTDEVCDSIDEDCDGAIDEDYVAQATTCGTSACENTGSTQCSNGFVYDSCTPVTPSSWTDSTCDNYDDDCDSMIDEDYGTTPTTCGVGACTSFGSNTCWEGVSTDDCVPNTPLAEDDVTCDGVDDDCDGSVDEDCGDCVQEYDQLVEGASLPLTSAIFEVASPYEQSETFNAARGSLVFQVEMPTALDDPYVLGEDFAGVAHICVRYDPVTGQEYDEVSMQKSWEYDSGGVYNLRHAYQPYTPGLGVTGSYTSVQTLVGVDGGAAVEKTDCGGGAAVEHPVKNVDIQLTPQMYENDNAIGPGRGAYANKWHYINSVNDMVTRINAAHTAKGSRVAIVLNSHGNIDWWRGWPGAFGVAGLGGNNASVVALGAAVRDKVSIIHFHSCCTAKGKTNGNNPNLLDAITDALTSGGQVWTRACGYNHYMYSWFRGGAFHVGHSTGDTEVCVH